MKHYKFIVRSEYVFVLCQLMMVIYSNISAPLDVNAPQTQYNPTTGETISLTCVITSGTATQVRWYKNNKLVIMAANLRLSGGNANTPSLIITQVQLTDAGSYICEATDGSATRNTTTITVSPKGSIQFLYNVDVWISLFFCGTSFSDTNPRVQPTQRATLRPNYQTSTQYTKPQYLNC